MDNKNNLNIAIIGQGKNKSTLSEYIVNDNNCNIDLSSADSIKTLKLNKQTINNILEIYKSKK